VRESFTKPPPLLLGAGLLFWGWQTDALLIGAVLAAGLESAHWIKARWEFTDEDFSRMRIFCELFLLAAIVYAFTSNQGPTDFLGLFEHPTPLTTRNAGTASARTSTALFRWMPMVFYLLMAAQTYSTQQGVPLQTISRIVGATWRKARKLGQSMPAGRVVDIGYPYFMVCLFASTMRVREGMVFFWGLGALLAWALWPQRSRRFNWALWVMALATAMALGYSGQRGLGRLQSLLGGYNPQWFTGRGTGADLSRSWTEIGQIGRVKTSGKIVIRLEPKKGTAAPPLLREASYRSYGRQVWAAGFSENDFVGVPETNGTSYVLLPGKTNAASVTIASYLPGGKGLLPLPRGSGQLDNLFVYLPPQKNSLGSVLAQGPGLVMFDAHYGPGATIDAAPNTNEDLAITAKELAGLDGVISEMQCQGKRKDQALGMIREFFQDKFTYSLWQPPAKRAAHRNVMHPAASTNVTKGTSVAPPQLLPQAWQRQHFPQDPDLTPLTRFLLDTRSGHCEYFATATVLLLRRLHIPARYAVGYAVHERTRDKYVVRLRDAHAWCLVWDEPSQSWQDFDTTPASWLQAEEQRASAFQFLSDAWSRLWFEISKLRWGQTQLRQYVLWALAPILALLLYQIIFRSRRRRQEASRASRVPKPVWPGLDSEFYQLEEKLVKRGLLRQESEPLSAWLVRVAADPALAPVRKPLALLLRLHYRYRFDPTGLDGPDREALRRQAQACLSRMG